MSIKQIRIFLVEDDLSFGSVLKSYLELNDYSVDWIDDGKFAIEHYRKGFFDICILDVMLPHVDGFTIAGEIRKMNPAVPIVFLTAKKLKEDVLKGYGIGADDYITKPLDVKPDGGFDIGEGGFVGIALADDYALHPKRIGDVSIAVSFNDDFEAFGFAIAVWFDHRRPHVRAQRHDTRFSEQGHGGGHGFSRTRSSRWMTSS